MIYYAHKINEKYQTLKEHCENVANICKKSEFINKDIAYIAGLFHDIGKAQKDFQDRLNGSSIRVDHAVEGALYIKELSFNNPYAQALAQVILGHHSGLPNLGTAIDTDNSTFLARIKKKSKFDRKFLDEIERINLPEFKIGTYKTPQEYFMFIRMLYSVLVDADFIDTETFMNGDVDRNTDYNFVDMYNKLENYLNDLDTKNPINIIRRELSETILKKVQSEKHIFYLDMPTGSGKTLASIRFALQRAIKLNKKRIIYVIPYTSIIEQNAEVLKKIFGNNMVLEHHSNFNEEKLSEEEKEKYSLSIQNWDAPIIVTTNVQFFESIYSNRSSRMRKLHNIANSIVCFDEIQMFPLELLDPCLEAINLLSKNFGVESILMSATIPEYNTIFNSLEEFEDLIDNKEKYANFKRCEIQNLFTININELIKKIDYNKSNLIVANTKNEAREIYENINIKEKLYLTTNLTPRDRLKKINIIKKKLFEGQAITVISTSLIEAGVDLDFDYVYRSLAGIDSVLQCAGRCNRECKKKNSITYVFENSDYFSKMQNDIKEKANITKYILNKYKDIASLEAIKDYFDTLYKRKIITIKNMNTKNYFRSSRYNNGTLMGFLFKDYAEDFCYINNDTINIVVAQEEAIDLLKDIEYYANKKILRKLQEYTISVYKNTYEKMNSKGLISKTKSGVLYLSNLDYYDENIGLDIKEFAIEKYIL